MAAITKAVHMGALQSNVVARRFDADILSEPGKRLGGWQRKLKKMDLQLVETRARLDYTRRVVRLAASLLGPEVMNGIYAKVNKELE